jgi:hypothetical protein
MKTSMRIKTVASIFLFIAVLGITGMASAAQYMWTSGTAAVLEVPTNVTSYKYMGWGLDMNHKSGLANWVHIPVPTPYIVLPSDNQALGARYIYLTFYTGSVDAWVSDIHVYNGVSRVFTVGGLSYSNGWKDIRIDMGKKIGFTRGMSISLRTAAGVESMNHRFIFSSAGAYFY